MCVDGVATVCTFAMQEIFNASGQVVARHPAGMALFHPEHDHWHQTSVTESRYDRRRVGHPWGHVSSKRPFA